MKSGSIRRHSARSPHDGRAAPQVAEHECIIFARAFSSSSASSGSSRSVLRELARLLTPQFFLRLQLRGLPGSIGLRGRCSAPSHSNAAFGPTRVLRSNSAIVCDPRFADRIAIPPMVCVSATDRAARICGRRPAMDRKSEFRLSQNLTPSTPRVVTVAERPPPDHY